MSGAWGQSWGLAWGDSFGALAVDVTIDVPASAIEIGALAPSASIGAAVAIPADLIAFDSFAPRLSIGAAVFVPVSQVTISAFAPNVITGVALNVPPSMVTLDALVPIFAVTFRKPVSVSGGSENSVGLSLARSLASVGQSANSATVLGQYDRLVFSNSRNSVIVHSNNEAA